jgi:uncharacterized BrkB/YihY/UPF0761 family membrane protein
MEQSDTFLQSAFSPLGKQYCDYFFYLTVFNFIILMYIIFSAIYIFLFDKKKETIFQVLLVSLPTILGYFTNRLLYSMCIGSTQM